MRTQTIITSNTIGIEQAKDLAQFIMEMPYRVAPGDTFYTRWIKGSERTIDPAEADYIELNVIHNDASKSAAKATSSSCLLAILDTHQVFINQYEDIPTRDVAGSVEYSISIPINHDYSKLVPNTVKDHIAAAFHQLRQDILTINPEIDRFSQKYLDAALALFNAAFKARAPKLYGQLFPFVPVWYGICDDETITLYVDSAEQTDDAACMHINKYMKSADVLHVLAGILRYDREEYVITQDKVNNKVTLIIKKNVRDI